MKPRPFLTPLLGVALGASLLGGFSLEAAPSEEAAKTVPAPAMPATPAAMAPAAAKPAEVVQGPDKTKLSAAITKSLGFLAKEGDEWITDKNCNSCHHLPMLLWSQHEAKRRGFAVDPKKFDEWAAWAAEHAKDNKPGLEEVALMILAMPEKPAPELTKIIVQHQQADGSWKPAGQFAEMQNRGAPDATAHAEQLSLLALATASEAPPAVEVARQKALAVLQKNEAPKAMDLLVFRALYAQSFGKAEEAAALRANLLKMQRNDGGWSYIIGANASDPLGTGQALYVLQSSTDPKASEAIARGQLWLLGLQRSDGSWPIDISQLSKVDRSGPAKASSLKGATGIYTFWGAAWATIGLLQSMPVVEEAPHLASTKSHPESDAPFTITKRWPVQILSAIYGTGGKDADVTAKVREHVEYAVHPFSVNPNDLGADPNPGWNKNLRIVYIKDGVRREQSRNENEAVLPESFYGPQDAVELRAWLTETRWIGEQPDLQFHSDHTFTSPGVQGTPQWEALDANKLRLIWADDQKAEFVFDYTWSSFSEVGNAKHVYHLKK